MTVGEPEINLNTWGLRYVRKGATPTQQLEKPTGDEGAYNPKTNPKGQSTTERTPSSRPTHGTNPDKTITSSTVGVSDTDINVPQQQGRQTDSQGDKDVKVQSATGSSRGRGKEIITNPQVHSSGKKYGVGGDEGATSTPPKMNDQSKEDKRVKEKRPDPKNTESMTTGVRSGKRGGKDTNPTQASSSTYLGGQHGDDAPTGKFGTVTTPARDEKGTRTKQPKRVEGALPKTKAELDLTIIKCKLLKLKGFGGTERTTASHGYGSKNRYGSENTGSASAGVDTSKLSTGKQDKTDTSNTQHSTAEGVDISPEEYKQGGDKVTDPHYSAERGQSFGDQASKVRGSKKSEDENTCTSCGKPKDDHYSEWGHARREHGDQKESIGDHMYKKSEDEIVHKAIELINQAYNGLEKKGEWDNVVKPSKRDDGDKTKKAEDEYLTNDPDKDKHSESLAIIPRMENSIADVMREKKERDDEKTKGLGGDARTTEKPFGKVLDEEGRPDEYTKEEHAEHESQKD